ncbi:MAG: type 2 isopentenyl-diphosphate Delta-isomerase [Desulfurococcales archaeon ex4484_42]|nr:MAG: type 2 isopentenyl-diphosphate Delta-isomerase [Desulfurococcales archaeon ex4484_42]
MVLGKNFQRKLEHIDIVLKEDVEGPLTTFFEYVFIPHYASSEIYVDDVNLRMKFLGKIIEAPIIISGMTGGAPGTERINELLASTAEELRIAIGVGSERAAIEDRSLEYTFRVVQKVAKTIPVIANIGAAEFVRYDIRSIERAIEIVEADALAIHLNLPQEYTQPEGKASFKGFKEKLVMVKDYLSVPIIIKEVGFGLSYEVAKELNALGIEYFDVAGAGGTNWVKVESFRAMRRGDNVKVMIARNILEWGIPTAASIIEVRNAAPSAFIIGSGGIRSAYDAIKALRIGADMIGIARPVLRMLIEGKLKDYMRAFILSMKALIAMTNSRSINELRLKPVIVTGLLKEWIEGRRLRI